MAQFIPRWDLKADTSVISEGGTTYIRISINRNSTDPNEYSITDDQHLEITYRLSSNGETFEERDFEVHVGENLNNLTPVQHFIGTKKIVLSQKDFNLSSTTQDIYFIKLYSVVDGVWDGPEALIAELINVNVVTITSGQVSNIEASGSIGEHTATITYNDSTEVWVTPGLDVRGEMFSICEMHYGSNSRAFVQAFGRSRRYDADIDGDGDPSNRVYVPSYRFLDIQHSSMPNTNRTGNGTIITTNGDIFPTSTEEMPLVIEDELGNSISTGLRFNGNGQMLGTFLYESDPIDAYFRVRIVDQRDYYTNERDAFFVGKRFKAYQMWVCPMDVSYISGSPLPGHLYQLKSTVVYPYVVKEIFENAVSYPVFNQDDWIDLGYYEPTLGSGIIGQERTFRMIVNDSTGDGIDFITESDLGSIHVGEYFGHTAYPVIRATGTMPTYQLLASSRDDITKYNIDVAADGTLVGTAYAMATDFTANDEIKLEFDVRATDINGASITSTFKIRIIRGFGQNFLTAYLQPSMPFERKWFRTISSSIFTQYDYYRTVDDRYGLQKYPRMLLKENLVSSTYPYTSLSDMKETLRNNIINPTGSGIPSGIFGFVMGNYRIRSALDSMGNVLYDVLYREIHPQGTTVQVSDNAYAYTIQDTAFLSEYFGLRENLFQAVGEDVTNLLSDPTDFNNRGLVVPAITGLSSEMIDTVPRYMNHPYLEDGVTAELLPVIPVAYCKPGQSEALYLQLIRSGEHSALVNESFNISYVEFQYFFQQYSKYVKDSYTIQIREQNRLGD